MNARRYGRMLTRALPALACALLAPASALAASGTSGGGGLTGGTGSSGAPVIASPGAEPVSVSSDGVTLESTSSALLRRELTFSGSAPAGRTVEVEREGQATHGVWVETVEATVSSTGVFSATWQTTQAGRFSVRAVLLSPGQTAVSADVSTAAAPASLTISVYRGARATIYGPGFYGRHTACGGRLSRATVGVANRTLPCGTQVSILFHGRALTVPVIDRGPYANGADWDLTEAAAAALGMRGTSTIGTLTVAGPTSTPSGPPVATDQFR